MILEGTLWDFTLMTPEQQLMPLSVYKDHVKAVLLVNTASRCGFTSQFKDLQELYQLYKDKGLLVLGVPSNDFFSQEPLKDGEIGEFCSVNYGVTFPLTSKIHVVRGDVDPLYKWLAQYTKPKWNFHKYLFNKEGHLVEAYIPTTTPLSSVIKNKIEELLV